MVKEACPRVFNEKNILSDIMEQKLHVVTGAFGYSGRWVDEHGPTFGNIYQNDLKVRKHSDPKQSNN